MKCTALKFHVMYSVWPKVSKNSSKIWCKLKMMPEVKQIFLY